MIELGSNANYHSIFELYNAFSTYEQINHLLTQPISYENVKNHFLQLTANLIFVYKALD